MRIKFSRLSSTAKLPTYATPGAAGMDLYADQDMTIMPGDSRLIGTNVAIELPFGLEAQVRPRSGLALKNRITVLNSPGTIDSDYRGGIGVILHNAGSHIFNVKPGDRIAQLVIAPYWRVEAIEVGELSGTARSDGGFGSTGISENPCKDILAYADHNSFAAEAK
jgi:dUTP pyrophosphatase